MKRFNFRLDRVRKWRQDQTELEEMRLQLLYTELRAIGAAQRELAAVADRSRRAVLAQSSVTAEELSSLEVVHGYTTREIQRLKGKEREVEAHVQEQQQRVLQAHRRFQLLDGLRDKALVAWTAERDKEQEELAAELFLANLSRKSALIAED